MAHIDFMALMAAENWEPYLALMLATATAGQFAAGDTSVGFGPVCKTLCFSKTTQMHDIVIGLFVNRYAFGRAV